MDIAKQIIDQRVYKILADNPDRNDYPALVVELKWNKSAKSALQQIKDRKYPASIEQYTGDILLVGINYDKKTKKHECVIEQYEK